MSQLLTPQQLADYLGVSRAQVYNLIARGLPSLKIARSRRFRPSEVDAWLDAQRNSAA
jgi:excisionase family DNA binding protein